MNQEQIKNLLDSPISMSNNILKAIFTKDLRKLSVMQGDIFLINLENCIRDIKEMIESEMTQGEIDFNKCLVKKYVHHIIIKKNKE